MSPGIPTRLLATQSDERLLALVRQGHERAFEALVHRYRRPLLGYCWRMRLPDARAEDVVQLALLKTWIAVREGAEVRDLKAWLYRVVHNTAINALRDSSHDGEPLADPTLGTLGSQPATDDSQIERGLEMREALAEVASLPPLQREVIVRTAVAGHSHEQVASDLGITNGAVRGLLYRARATLRTAITALTPPPLLAWLAGRSEQSGPAPERLAEVAAGGGAASLGGAAGAGGLLLKAGAVVLTAGTVITGATVAHLGASSPRRARHTPIVTALSVSGHGADASGALATARDREPSFATAFGAHRGSTAPPGRHRSASIGRPRERATKPGASGFAEAPHTNGSGHAPRSTTRTTGTTRRVLAAREPAAPGPTPGSSQGPGAAGGSSQGPGSSPSGEAAGSGGPVGSAAASGSPGGGGAGGSAGGASGEGGVSGGGQGGAGSGAGPGGSGSGSGSGAGGSESSNSKSSTSGSEPSSSEQPGSLVGAVVHEVGSIVEHLLH